MYWNQQNRKPIDTDLMHLSIFIYFKQNIADNYIEYFFLKFIFF